MDGVSDSTKYHYQYFWIIFQVKVIRGREGEKVKVLSLGILVTQYMF